MATVTVPFVLVLDDLHVVAEPAIYVALDYLLERLPAQMHLVVASRHDPPLSLARLRARRQVVELRLGDLRFSWEEANHFLNQTLDLDLPPEHLQLVYNRTEGWAAGLTLLVSSLDRSARSHDRQTFLAHLAHTDRYIFDFLVDEVLRRQEREGRDFLLHTSVLAELTPDLCAAVTDRPDAACLLEEIYRHNLFLTLTDARAASYRYHDLFREFLLRRLAEEAPQLVHDLHRRAAGAETVPSHAIRHYLAAEEWEAAARVIEAVGEEMLAQGALEGVQGWIEALPVSVRAAHPRLLYFLGVAAWDRWQVEEATSLLKRALAAFEQARR